MKKLKSIKDIDIHGRKVLMRVDFNVPVIKGKVGDNFKMERAHPTIKYLLKQKCQVILVSHLGRPEGRRVKALTLKPVFNQLRMDLPSVSMKFIDDKLNDRINEKIKKSRAQVILLENIRYEKGEDKNDKKLGELLGGLAEIYVNEAFAACHRALASNVAVAKYLPSFAGLNLENEYKYLTRALKPKKPAVALIGGAKIKTKAAVINNFSKLYNKILLGGGLANTFIYAKGYEIGDSLCDYDQIRKARILLKSKKVVLPVDVVVSDKKTRRKIRVVKIAKEKKLCNQDEQILDIGPETIKLFAVEIKKAQTIIWNGPMGLLENKSFRHGTLALAKIMAARSSGRALGICGGGETLYAVTLSKMGRYYDFVSTGGGAMLQFLEGKNLPGLKAIIK